MLIRLWGVRGSIPTPSTTKLYRQKLSKVLRLASEKKFETDSDINEFIESLDPALNSVIGGNTPCVEVLAGDTRLVFDMGSGMRPLGNFLLDSKDPNTEMHVFISHTHWDHIQGWVFFKPGFIPSYKMNFYSPHGNFEQRLNAQQDFRFFPVPLNFMASHKEFHDFTPESSVVINGIKISNTELHHPGKSYGYRVEYGGKVFVYATDSEYNNFNTKRYERLVDFFKDADALIFDAQYSFDQEIQRIDWGHSSAFAGVDLAIQANVKELILFHHDPDNTDFQILSLYDLSIKYLADNYPQNNLTVTVAREGAEFNL
ncbi:MAG: MBL fold metallo-hydrolase [Ignavibacteriales bacterium]|nr:MAG: MBL fold metallo-hydrolase [Ignavibacteriaceae bacterium]MBW7872520.1 MBL fold metallo-hydrolase [Ignavibacteria bacterium]MCZ2141927.1 MBL fold metallo-hydrolase [Ignavibacteriales bacterium]OQY79545.1 MAG: hypothetical protein B6D45_00715 [Ignavibacteriales bacterium UTCHB3]MBV6445093.1 Ribonuclease BN [Ignavibacteriaceae bacterium]